MSDERSSKVRATDLIFGIAENALYAVTAVVLVAGAILLLGDAAIDLVRSAFEDVVEAVTHTLDRLLLVFILVELLGAVRATMRERKLVGEPFLIVGMIASIKEIIVIAIGAKEQFGKGPKFTDAMIEIGVLSGLLLALGVTTYLLRRKEREPEE